MKKNYRNKVYKSIGLIISVFISTNTLANTEIRMSWWGGSNRHQATLEAIEKFEQQNPNIIVKSEPSGWDGQLTRLSTQIAGNTEPDVMQINWNWLVMFSKDGKGFADLNNEKGIIDLSQYSDSSKSLVSVNGNLNGVPISLTGRSMYYNPDLWKQAGISYPQSWDDMLKSGQVFKEKLGEEYFPFVLANHDTTIMTFLNSYMIQKYNVEMFNVDKKSFNYTNEQWKDFFGLYKQLVDSHVIPSMKYLASFGKANAWEIKPWIDGKIGGVHTWSTDGTFSSNLRPPAYLEVGPYPMLPGATDAGVFFKPSMMFSIGKNSKHPKEAAKLINFLLNDPDGVKSMGLQRGVPLSDIGRKILEEDGTINTSQLQVQGINQVKSLVGNIQPSPYFENPRLLSLFLDLLQQYDYGKISIDELAERFPSEGKNVLRRIM